MNILVALEETKFSDKALALAVDIANKTNAHLTAISVIEECNDLIELYPGMIEVISDRLKKQASEVTEHAKQYAKNSGLKIDTVIAQKKTAYDGILEYAKSNSIDMIVVGSNGSERANKFCIGTVASKVARHATCSVTVAR